MCNSNLGNMHHPIGKCRNLSNLRTEWTVQICFHRNEQETIQIMIKLKLKRDNQTHVSTNSKERGNPQKPLHVLINSNNSHDDIPSKINNSK